MRIDKWLKITRLIKRRTIAQLACEEGYVLINDKIAKPASTVKPGDIIKLTFGGKIYNYKVLTIDSSNSKQGNLANLWYEML